MSIQKILFAPMLLVASFASAEAPAANSGEIKQFNLKTAIAFATEHSPTFDTLQRNLTVAELEEKSAQSRLLPSLDLTATHGLSQPSYRPQTTPWVSELNVGVTWSLYDNGIGYKNYQIAVLNRKVAEKRFQEEKNKFALDIVSEYLRYSLNIKLLEIQQKQFQLVEKQYGLISGAYHQGIKTKRDFLGIRSERSRGSIGILSAKNAIASAKESLKALVGIPLDDSSEVEFVPISMSGDQRIETDSAVDLKDHLLFHAAEDQREIYRLTAELSERKRWPEWYFSTGVNYSSSNYIGTGQSVSDNAQVGSNALLVLKWNLFDWGIRGRDAKVTQQKARVSDNQLDTELLQLKASINQLKTTLLQIQQNFDLAKELLLLERENLESIQTEYRNGKIPYLNLTVGLSNLADAEVKFYSAASDVLLKKYTLLYHQGKLYEVLIR